MIFQVTADGLKPRTVSARHLKKFKVYTFDEYMVGFDRSCMMIFLEKTQLFQCLPGAIREQMLSVLPSRLCELLFLPIMLQLF